jgi:predicted glutamine amidotransferase
MCRFVAYQGTPLFHADLVCNPANSLVQQSMSAQKGKTQINGDGFGLGWYGQDLEPRICRSAEPAWADEKLQGISTQVRSSLFFAHVRASTGAAAAVTNCHPFARRNWLFMHNGQIDAYSKVRHAIESLNSGRSADKQMGTTDSEAIFLTAPVQDLGGNPVHAVASTLRAIARLMADAAIQEPLRFNAVLTNGTDLFGFRWASDDLPPRLYYRHIMFGLTLASEPVDGARENWKELANASVMISRPGNAPIVCSLEPVLSTIAA